MTDAELTFQQVCWIGNQNSFVVWIGTGQAVEFIGNDNFVSEDESSLSCLDPGRRILLEDTFECLPGADDSPICLADEVFTDPPTNPPVMGPSTPTRAPSVIPPPSSVAPVVSPPTRAPRPTSGFERYCEYLAKSLSVKPFIFKRQTAKASPMTN